MLVGIKFGKKGIILTVIATLSIHNLVARITQLLACLSLCFAFKAFSEDLQTQQAQESEPVDDTFIVVVPSQDLQDFYRYLKGRDPLVVTEFDEEGATRPVVELILLHQALALGGLHEPLQLTAVESYKRMIAQVSQGRAVLRGISAWREDTLANEDQLYISEPLIRDGEFEVGFYSSPDNPRTNQIKSAEQFTGLTAVTNPNWSVDWRTLHGLGLKHVYSNNKYQGMLRQVMAQHVDVLLSPFPPRDGMVLEMGDIRLTPIKGFKTVLQGSRHWVVSREHPKGQTTFQALSKGLAKLRQEHRVVKAYQDSGVFNVRVKDWQWVRPKADGMTALEATY
jgi:hypothetical protein